MKELAFLETTSLGALVLLPSTTLMDERVQVERDAGRD
jgi:hypothetical protein